MRVYKRLKLGSLAFGLCSLGAWATLVLADFRVQDVQPRLKDNVLEIQGNLDLGLTDKVEEALSKGIPLIIDIEIGLYLARPIIWDKHVADWKERRQIRYHALSSQYLVSTGTPDAEETESYTSLQKALEHMGSLEDLSLPLSAQFSTGDGRYIVLVRASLDIESLPAPLRPVAYTSNSWRLNSGWTEWKLQP